MLGLSAERVVPEDPDHNPSHCADCKARGPHRGPYRRAAVGSAVRTSHLAPALIIIPASGVRSQGFQP